MTTFNPAPGRGRARPAPPRPTPRPDTGSATGRRAGTEAERLAWHRRARARLRSWAAALWALVALEVVAIAGLVIVAGLGALW